MSCPRGPAGSGWRCTLLAAAAAVGVGWVPAPTAATAQDPAPTGASPERAVVRGTVFTSEGGALAYARIELVGDSAMDWTDEDGAYRLDGVSPGDWRLRVAHPGHDSLEVGLVVPARGVRLDVTLQARPGPSVDALADFEPFVVRYTLPTLLNGDSVSDLMRQLYPAHLEERGIGGQADLLIWLDEMGHVARSRIAASSGWPALDSLALEVSDRMRFRPARNRDQPIRVYVRIPVVFTVPDSLVAQGSGTVRRGRPR